MSSLNINTLNFSSHLRLVRHALVHPDTVVGVSLWQGRFVTFNEGNGGVSGSMSLQDLAHRVTQAIQQIHNDNSPVTPEERATCYSIANALNQYDAGANQLIAQSHFLFRWLMALRDYFFAPRLDLPTFAEESSPPSQTSQIITPTMIQSIAFTSRCNNRSFPCEHTCTIQLSDGRSQNGTIRGDHAYILLEAIQGPAIPVGPQTKLELAEGETLAKFSVNSKSKLSKTPPLLTFDSPMTGQDIFRTLQLGAPVGIAAQSRVNLTGVLKNPFDHFDFYKYYEEPRPAECTDEHWIYVPPTATEILSKWFTGVLLAPESLSALEPVVNLLD